jgi:hypothetical protein
MGKANREGDAFLVETERKFSADLLLSCVRFWYHHVGILRVLKLNEDSKGQGMHLF